MTKLADLKKRLLQNAEVRRGYEEAANEFALSAALLEARAKAKMSQADVAQKLNTSQPAIARLESGRIYPSLRTLRRYAQAVGAEVEIRLVSRHNAKGAA